MWMKCSRFVLGKCLVRMWAGVTFVLRFTLIFFYLDEYKGNAFI